MSHTKGKWVVQVSTDGDGANTNDIKRGCTTIACDIPNDDDAFLIAAAPALLAACERDAELANAAILATPTREYRNKLTEINILRLQAIAEAKK